MGGGGAQIVHTVCMDTRDAIHTEEGQFTMKLGGDNPRFQAIKVALGSLEFPITQWTIEEDWNRLYYSEGYRLTSDSSWLHLEERADDETNTVMVTLPQHVNEIVEFCRRDGFVKVTCANPHGLWVDGRRCLIDAIDWGDVEIVCGVMGRVSLSALHQEGNVEYLNDNEFIVPDFKCDVRGGGFLHVPVYPSPSALCATISFALTYSTALAQYEVEYDPKSNKASLRATIWPPESSRLVIRLYGSELASLLGYPSPVHERVFNRRRTPQNLVAATSNQYDFFNTSGTDDVPLVLPSEPFAGWQYVTLEPGWYTPAQRPMCTGQPLRFQQEVELALNRLHFPVPDRIPQGMATAHFLMFNDPGGTMHNCPVYPGRYTAESLASLLETEMTRLSARSMPGVEFSVEYDAEAERFTFQCEVREEGGQVRPAPFDLLFGHPAQFDPSRIGFGTVSLYGFDAYTSTHRVRVPHRIANSAVRPASNVYRVTEITHQKRLRVQGTPSPQIIGIITDYDASHSVLRLRTYSGQLPYAHGLHAGDVVQITPCGSTELFVFDPDEGDWKGTTLKRCPIAPSWGRSGVVVECADAGSCGPPMPAADHVDLCVRVRSTSELAECIGQVLHLQTEVLPVNLCFGLPKSIPNTHLGFPLGAVQAGLDGMVRSGRSRVGPLDAPAVHALDHPDYILIYLNEGKMSTSLQHQRGSNATSPFAKLVLYPMFREERMLPRETTLLSGESLSVFTLRFANPDGTPYHFHGATFSFSLNFIRVQD